MSKELKVLVRLHNLVNIPRDIGVNTASESNNDPRVFSVILRAVARDGTLIANCAEVRGEFTVRDIVRSATDDFLEVKLDVRGEQRGAAASAEWTVNTSTLELLLIVKEQHPSGVRVVGTCPENLLVNVDDIVQKQKLVTHVLGTEMGQIGLSLAVAPSDVAGYQQRLVEFLSEHNPGGLRFVESVVCSIAEIDTFTKLYRKYHIVDYEQRIMDFFRLYGREHANRVPTLLREWENHEEELMHNLVLDNGPEPHNLNTALRLEAFLKAHNVTSATPEVAHAMREFRGKPRELFLTLTEIYGVEPDPRSYLFPPTHYQKWGEQQQQQQQGDREKKRFEEERRIKEDTGYSHGSALAVSSSASPFKWLPHNDVWANDTHQIQQNEKEGERGNENKKLLSSSSQESHIQQASTILSMSRDGKAGATIDSTVNKSKLYRGYNDINNSNSNSYNHNNSNIEGKDPLWDAFCESFVHNGRQISDLYYMNERTFYNIVDEIGYNKSDRDALVYQWQKRLRASVREDVLSPGDAYYDTVVKEVLDVVGLPQLNLEVMDMVSVMNKVHASCFNSRLLAAHQRATERLAIVGDYQRLHNIVSYGVDTTHVAAASGGDNTDGVVVAAAAADNTGSSPRNVDGDGNSGGNPCMVFHRRPFQNWDGKHTTCILICDVVVGKPFVCPASMKTARTATAAFRREWDCCVFTDGVAGPAVAVYDSAQLLPRYLLRCRVDMSIAPCPTHPTRPLEYYIPGENEGPPPLPPHHHYYENHENEGGMGMVGGGVLVCGDCVVLGPYRGRPVVPLAAVAPAARAALAAGQHDARQLAAAAQQQAEQHAEAQRHAARVAAAAAALAGNIAAKMQQSNPLHVLTALQQLRTEKALQQLREELGEEGYPSSGGIAGTQYEGSRSNGNDDGGAQVKTPLNRGHSHQNSSIRLPSRLTEVQTTPTNHTSNSLYAKYLAAVSGTKQEQDEQKQEQQQYTSRPEDVRKNSNHYSTNEYGNNISIISNNNNGSNKSYPKKGGDISDGSSRMTSVMPGEKTRLAKEDVTYGWHLYRQGDIEGARRVWTAVYERHMDDAVGARARAYIAEAVDRDYEAAASWYTVSLQRDPHDAMTMYNYAVLLEALLGRRQEALLLFERAHALGDVAAGRRAQQLRVSLNSS
ncbi:uncharacterized protein TM35_000361020 [Trypanosoma theileri]|uniref:Uncharacterized protein n=1 Tax=Trypanosoma theileri TaxID=67003 RepID=A0A1X0NKF3_9TRYP|nr:uncharacterized protein TM35_000401360 [Trypanosoma theileri]XP_028879308.1 uncharacterized protein TM35_000361020 [Trypanosoma theileri]ORC84869.1 hypothetical protein TM35_000401360 [Trypanosoma theileri]ORC85242.1 hypothetical protein TM35_000361020 [Trypanosoma theileri]